MTKITERNELSSSLTVDKALIERAIVALTNCTGDTPAHGLVRQATIRQIRAALKEGNEVDFAKTEPAVEPVRPDVLEKLSYHCHERDDLTLDDCLTYLQTNGWYKVMGRTERQMWKQSWR